MASQDISGCGTQRLRTTEAPSRSATARGAASARGYRRVLLPRPDLAGVAQGGSGTVLEALRRAVLTGDAVVALITALTVVALARTPVGPVPLIVAMALPAAWLGLLAARGSYRRDPLAEPWEPIPVLTASGLFLLSVICGAFLLDARLPRAVLLAAAVLLVAGSAVVRLVAEGWLRRQRRQGRGVIRVLVVGHPEPAAGLIEKLDAAGGRGLVAIGAVLRDDGTGRTPAYGVAAMASSADVAVVLDAVDELAVDAVALCSDLDLSGWGLRLVFQGLLGRGVRLLALAGTGAVCWAPQARPLAGSPLVQLTVRSEQDMRSGPLLRHAGRSLRAHATVAAPGESSLEIDLTQFDS